MSKTEFNLPASFMEWLGDNKLCPCRLDANFKVIHKPGYTYKTSNANSELNKIIKNYIYYEKIFI